MNQITMNQVVFWEKFPNILEKEIREMANCFPDFKLEEYSDGRKYFVGTVILEEEWRLKVEYDEYFPHYWLKQDLIRVYCDNPDFEQVIRNAEGVPRILLDPDGKPYISTYLELVKNKRYKFSALDHLEFAIMWLTAYEQWLTAIRKSTEDNVYNDYFYRGKRLQKKKIKRRH